MSSQWEDATDHAKRLAEQLLGPKKANMDLRLKKGVFAEFFSPLWTGRHPQEILPYVDVAETPGTREELLLTYHAIAQVIPFLWEFVFEVSYGHTREALVAMYATTLAELNYKAKLREEGNHNGSDGTNEGSDERQGMSQA